MVSELSAGFPIEPPLLVAFSPFFGIPVVRGSIRCVRESRGMSEQMKHGDAVFAIRPEFGNINRYWVVQLELALG